MSFKEGDHNRLLDFAGASRYNCDLFLLQFSDDYKWVAHLIASFENIWQIVGLKRDKDGVSQVGLGPMQGVVLRQMVYAFDSLQGSQITQVWLNVRLAIESLLYMGKWVHDSSTCKIWENKEKEFRTYKNVFETNLERDNALVRSESFRRIMKSINDEYLHPNPRLIFSPLTSGFVDHPDPGMRGIETVWLGQDLGVVEVHLLAFGRLFADIVDASAELVNDRFGTSFESGFRQSYEGRACERAKMKAALSKEAKLILLSLGAWNPTLL